MNTEDLIKRLQLIVYMEFIYNYLVFYIYVIELTLYKLALSSNLAHVFTLPIIFNCIY